MRRFLIILFVIFLIPNVAYARDINEEEYKNVLSQYDLSFFEDRLGDEAYSFLEQLGIDDFSFNSINSVNISKIFDIITDIISGKIQTPLKCCVGVMVFVIISCLVKAINPDNDSFDGVFGVVASLVISTLVLSRLSVTVGASVGALRISADFIYGFIPVFCAVCVASGNATVAFSTNTLLLTLAQGLSFVASNVFMPLINCFLALGICSSIRYELHLNRFISSLKQIITKGISFLFGVFVSVLSIKTAVAGRADMLGLRSIRFAVNAVIPVIGSSISEGLLSIQGYSSLIKTSVGVVGIIGIVLVFLPSVIEVSIWRLLLCLCSTVSDIFEENTVSATLSALRDAMLLINVLLIMSMVTTVISLGIIIAARGGA